jgi:pyruvate carboxylase
VIAGELLVELGPVPKRCRACMEPITDEGFKHCPFCGEPIQF